MLEPEAYAEFNRRMLLTIRETERLAKKFLYDEAILHYPMLIDLVGAERLEAMRGSREVAVAGLTDPNPKVRLAALFLFGDRITEETLSTIRQDLGEEIAARVADSSARHDFTPDLADTILHLATADPEVLIRHQAIVCLPYFASPWKRNYEMERKLAEQALATEDVKIRYLAARTLPILSGIFRHSYPDTVYMTAPLMFDEYLISRFIEPHHVERLWLRPIYWFGSIAVKTGSMVARAWRWMVEFDARYQKWLWGFYGRVWRRVRGGEGANSSRNSRRKVGRLGGWCLH